jgi:hypothetical protein
MIRRSFSEKKMVSGVRFFLNQSFLIISIGHLLSMGALPNPVSSSRSPRAKDRQSQSARRQAQSPAQRPARKLSLNADALTKDLSRARFWESGVMLGMNILLMGTAIVTLAHLIPYQMTQQAKLQELRSEESNMAQTLANLKKEYELSQSPEIAQRIAQEQGNLMRANYKRVFTIPAQKIQ